MYAVKKQNIKDPLDLETAAYREVRVLTCLGDLTKQNKCDNFVALKEWFKEAAGKTQVMFIVLELAGDPISDIVELPLLEYKQVCFQLVWALRVAYEEFGFVHG